MNRLLRALLTKRRRPRPRANFWAGMEGVEQDPQERARLREELNAIPFGEHPMGNAPRGWKPEIIRDPEGFARKVARRDALRERLGQMPWQHSPSRVGMPRPRHLRVVRKALEAGKTVPSAVLELHGLANVVELPEYRLQLAGDRRIRSIATLWDVAEELHRSGMRTVSGYDATNRTVFSLEAPSARLETARREPLTTPDLEDLQDKLATLREA